MLEKNKESKSQAGYDASSSIIPARIIIGVTGHRRLNNELLLSEKIQDVLKRITKLAPPMNNTPLILSILSPLAEGADQLVVREILDIPGSELEVVLPLEKDDYFEDFESDESKAEFEKYVSQAIHSRQLPSPSTRNEAYEQVGRFVVDHCDVLIALWNGKPAAGQGGTAEIVEYARKKMCPIFWIHTEDRGKIIYEPGNKIDPRPFRDLDRYNSEKADVHKVKERIDEKQRQYLERAEESQYNSERLRQICEHVIPHFIRADMLALRYQHLYFKAGSLVYMFAAAAVIVAAVQALFFPVLPRIALIEAGFIFVVLLVVWLGNRQKWHSKWIDYRFLAERFRSAFFMALANVDVSTLRPPRHLSLSYSSQDWMVSAFSFVWRQFPRSLKPDPAKYDALRKFTLNAWIDDQISYHTSTSIRHQRRHNRMAYTGNVLFGLTFIAVMLHVLHVGGGLYDKFFLLMAIVFPTAAGALAATRTHREYFRNARRSIEMVRHLEELKEQMKEASDLEAFLPLVKEAEETMLHENEDWRIVIRFHELEPPG
jgi:hypothetical protein